LWLLEKGAACLWPAFLLREGLMLEFAVFQLPDLTESIITVAWIAGGAVALLLVWEIATFAAYVMGVGDRHRQD
jgi:hypothetical protein